MLRLGSNPTRRPGPRRRPQAGLRLALLSLATVILLLGAVIAGVFCYETIGHGLTHGGSAGAETDVGAHRTYNAARPGVTGDSGPGGRTALSRHRFTGRSAAVSAQVGSHRPRPPTWTCRESFGRASWA